jgi:hypothetical protein
MAAALWQLTTSHALEGGSWAIPEQVGMGCEDMREGAGGVVGLRGAGLLGLEGALDLPLSLSSPAFLLASLETGHWCHFLALCDVNFCL